MFTYSALRKKNYEYRINNRDYNFKNYKKYPYTHFKAKLYIELSTILIFIFQFTRITPNQISLIYALSGVVGGLLISSSIKTLIVIGLTIFVLKNTLDWTDGFYAKIKNQKSIIGHILDTWGSHIGQISLVISIGIYCYNYSGNDIYLIGIIIILFLNAVNFRFFAYHQLFYEILNNQLVFKINKNKNIELKNNNKNKNFVYLFLKNFMDSRARTVDSVCLLIFIEIIFALSLFSKVIFALYFLQNILLFFGNFYISYFKDEIKNRIND